MFLKKHRGLTIIFGRIKSYSIPGMVEKIENIRNVLKSDIFLTTLVLMRIFQLNFIYR